LIAEQIAAATISNSQLAAIVRRDVEVIIGAMLETSVLVAMDSDAAKE
jgi:hypothetical protein